MKSSVKKVLGAALAVATLITTSSFLATALEGEVSAPVKAAEESAAAAAPAKALPAGASEVERVDFVLSEDTVVFDKDVHGASKGEVANGAIVHDNSRHIRGGVEKMLNDVYLKAGNKVARFYVRITDKLLGGTEGGIATFTLKKNGAAAQEVKALLVDFKDKVNQVLLYTIPFTAESGAAYNVGIFFEGNKTTVVDKIEIADEKDLTYAGTEREITPVSTAAGNKFTLDRAVLAGLGAMDSLILKEGDCWVKIGCPMVAEYFEKGYQALEIVFGNPAPDAQTQIENFVNNSAVVDKMFILKSIRATLIDSAGIPEPVSQFDSVFKIGFKMNDSIKEDFAGNYNALQGYRYLWDKSSTKNISTSLSEDGSYAILEGKFLGEVLLGKMVVATREYKPYDPKPEFLREGEYYGL